MNIANWLYRSALYWGDRPAILSGNDVVATYDVLLGAVCRRADDLSRRFSVGPGDRVAIYAKNCPEYIEVMHACWWLGAVVVPVNCKLHPNEARWIIADADVMLTYTDNGQVFAGDVLEAAISDRSGVEEDHVAPRMVDDDTLAWLFYTSGTTGKPKGVMLSHGNLRDMALCYTANVDSASMHDTVVYAAPLSHGAGLYMFAHLRAGAAHLVPVSRGFDGDEIIDLALLRGGLVFFAAPTMVKRLIGVSRRRGHDGRGIRTIIYGGGPMYFTDINDALNLYGPRFAQIYGQGETPMTIAAMSREMIADIADAGRHNLLASVGVAASSVEISIRDADGCILPTGRTGEICVCGPTVMCGYWRNPAATAEAVVDGWLATGDLGHLDAKGFLHLTDRSKDVIISGGSNIYPREVEEVILGHADVFEVAVVGAVDADWGEVVVAHIVLNDAASLTAADLDNWCKAQIASFKKPKHYVFHDALPKNSYGKILKTELRQGTAGQQLR